jgi:hypothetical protein
VEDDLRCVDVPVREDAALGDDDAVCAVGTSEGVDLIRVEVSDGRGVR